MLSTALPLHSLPSWCSELLQVRPSSHHLLSSCTNTSSEPPFLPKSAALTQQPPKFANRLLPTLMPPNHRQTITANLLDPCMLVSQLPCMTPFARLGSLLQWYESYPRTATRYAPAIVLSITTQDDTYMNVVSSLPTLFQMSQQPQCRLLPDLMSLHHSLHPPSLHNWCNLQLQHPQYLQLPRHQPQLFPPCQLSQRLPLHLCLQHSA